MNKFAIAASLLLAACSHPAYNLTAPEQCATNQMILDGITLSNGGAVTTVGKQSAYTLSSSQAVQCRRPQSSEEQCEIRSQWIAIKAKSVEAANVTVNQLTTLKLQSYDACMNKPGAVEPTLTCFKYWGSYGGESNQCFSSLQECVSVASKIPNRQRKSECHE
jgi:hypothetical protein